MLNRIHGLLLSFLLLLLWPGSATAQTVLTRAVIEAIRNQVQILPENRPPRDAQISDVVTPGSGVATARNSLAELRFNDGSLGRLGEQVIFWFIPNEREFRLSNGTMLLLIPPGNGPTRIHTPNATAGVQGSGLIVRYDPRADRTIVVTLTDSGIVVANQDGSQFQEMAGGQLIVVERGAIRGLYDVDLRTLYETSPLLRELTPEDLSQTEPSLVVVQQEMETALEAQPVFSPDQVVVNPPFIQRSPSSTDEMPAIERPSFNTPPTNPTPVPDSTQDFRNPPGSSFPQLERPSSDRLDTPRPGEAGRPVTRPDNDNRRPDVMPPGLDRPGTMPPGQDPGFVPPGQDPGFVPPGLDRPGVMPPGQDPGFVPPGQDRPDFIPPGQDPGFVPPGQDRPDFTPPGQDRPDFIPPGQDPDFIPPGQDPDFIPPGQDPDFIPPGQDRPDNDDRDDDDRDDDDRDDDDRDDDDRNDDDRNDDDSPERP
jgi:hypothetical protein